MILCEIWRMEDLTSQRECASVERYWILNMMRGFWLIKLNYYVKFSLTMIDELMDSVIMGLQKILLSPFKKLRSIIDFSHLVVNIFHGKMANFSCQKEIRLKSDSNINPQPTHCSLRDEKSWIIFSSEFQLVYVCWGHCRVVNGNLWSNIHPCSSKQQKNTQRIMKFFSATYSQQCCSILRWVSSSIDLVSVESR